MQLKERFTECDEAFYRSAAKKHGVRRAREVWRQRNEQGSKSGPWLMNLLYNFDINTLLRPALRSECDTGAVERGGGGRGVFLGWGGVGCSSQRSGVTAVPQ